MAALLATRSNVGQLWPFLNRNRCCSHDHIAAADCRLPFERHVFAASLGSYHSPVARVLTCHPCRKLLARFQESDAGVGRPHRQPPGD